MSIKSFEVDWGGEPETIEYEDDIDFGTLDNVLKNSVDTSNPLQPKINIGEYRIRILLAVLRKAPFNYSSINEIKKQSAKKMSKVVEGIMEDYAMVNFLEDLMTSLVGSEIMKKLDSESMPSVSPNLGGPKTKSTNVAPNSSDK